MYEALVRKARDLKRRSRKHRDDGDYDGAEGLLRNAIALLDGPVQKLRDNLIPGVAASQDVRDLAAELADCWGSLGGVQRRQAEALRRRQEDEEAQLRFNDAIEAYSAGVKLEQDDRFRIANSYNLVQRVIVPLMTSSEVLHDPAFKSKLIEVQQAIERQTKTSRTDDPWAYSDLGLVQLLIVDELTANETWDQMDALKPERHVYTSGLPVLQSLSDVLPKHGQLRRAVERFRASAGSLALTKST